ncbi:hypothetical protein BH09ACT11_BH09ACT11_10360 [soil metagenome]
MRGGPGIDLFEQVFDTGGVSVTAQERPPSGPEKLAEIERLRARMARMAPTMSGRPLPTMPGLGLELSAGGSYAVDSLSLATALLAGPSAAGEWGAVIGVADFGVEAACEMGVALERTIVVPDPGEIWLEATAALIDVVTLVVVRPPTRVTEAAASKVSARLRKRGAALVALGEWPRADARLSATSVWTGPETGEGHLTGRRVQVEVRRGSAPPRRVDLAWGEQAWGEQAWSEQGSTVSRLVRLREVG